MVLSRDHCFLGFEAFSWTIIVTIPRKYLTFFGSEIESCSFYKNKKWLMWTKLTGCERIKMYTIPVSSAAEIVVWSMLIFLAESSSLDLAFVVVAVMFDDFFMVLFRV